MKLYIGEQMILPSLGRMTLRKNREEASATLTAELYTAAADTYFQTLSLAVGDRVRLLDDEGGELFLGSIHELRRTAEQVSLTAYDQGICLTRNELRGVFCGSGKEIAEQVARQLDLPLGTAECDAGYHCIVCRSGQSAFSLLRSAVGDRREISVRSGTLEITRSAWMVYPLQPSQVLESGGCVSLREMVNRCVVVNRKGIPVAEETQRPDAERYGQMQTVQVQNSADPARQAREALRGRSMTGEITVLGNPTFRCGCAVELHRSDWGVDGVYAVTAAEHRWERGFYTTTMDLEYVRA